MLKKIKAQILLNFGQNHPKLFGTEEKLPKDSWKMFFRFLSKMWYLLTKNMKGVTVKCGNLQRGQSDPAFGKTSKHFFAVAPFMVQISPKYYHSLEPQNQTRHQ